MLTRRDFLRATAAGAALPRVAGLDGAAPAAQGVKPMRGAFMILHTPFTDAGAVDWDDLLREASFVDRCGAHGIVWPQGSSSVANLTKDERMRGMALLAGAVRGWKAVLALGVQGTHMDEMLEYARRAEALAPDAMIAMPPSGATSVGEYREYFRALARVTARPVIIQTSGGARDLPPPVELIVELAREFPHLGYVKEESAPIIERMTAEIARRPPMKRVFGANFGQGWLYEMRLGLDGVITGNAMYADLMAKIWELHESGQRDRLRDAFGRFLLMRNLSQQLPGVDLYIFRKRGIFKTTATRGSGGAVVKASLTAEAIAEIDDRFAALGAYLSSTS